MKLTSSIVAGAFLLAGTAAFAQSATATASANIITSLALVNNAALAFGSITASNTGSGTVVVAPAGTRTSTGAVTLVGGGGSGTATAASFTANGTGSQTYTISVPGSSITLSDGATHNMTVDTFTCSLPLTTGGGTLSSGTQTFTVGGTLNVAASQVPGTYTGTFSVSVAYN